MSRQAQLNGKGTLDDIDREIIEAVRAHARISNAKLARRVGLSESATLERVRRLERDHVILGYRAEVDAGVLGRNVMALVSIRLHEYDETKVLDFIENLEGMPEVITVYQVLGSCDFVAQVAAASVQDLEELFSTKLAVIKAVGHTESMFVLKTLKDHR